MVSATFVGDHSSVGCACAAWTMARFSALAKRVYSGWQIIVA